MEAWLAAAVAISCAVLLGRFYPEVAAGEVVRVSVDWVPQYGLSFGLRLDGFAWMFAMMVTVIGALVVVYARYYMSPADPVPRFFSFLLAFMGSMLGVVLSGNLIQLVVFWELTSFTSFVLIAYWYHRADARHIGAVEEDGDAGFDRGVAGRADAADREADVARLRALGEAQVRRDLGQSLDVDDIVLFKRLAGKGRDRNRNVLDVLGALLGGYDDFAGVGKNHRIVGR